MEENILNLRRENFLGFVIFNNDPLFSGRAKIRVFNLFDNIEDEALPWFKPMFSPVFGTKGQGSLSVPKIGTIVRVRFNNGDIYNGEYTVIEDIDKKLIEEIKEDYVDTQVLLHDDGHELFVIFQPNRGLQIFYQGSYFKIHPDNMISIVHANNTSLIELIDDKINVVSDGEVNVGGNSNTSVNVTANNIYLRGRNGVHIEGNKPDEVGVNGNALFILLETLAKMIDAKQPSSPGIALAQVEASKAACLNSNVKYGKFSNDK